MEDHDSTDDAIEAASPSSQPAPDEGDGDAGEDGLTASERYIEQIRRANALIAGKLTLQYRSRDVTVPLDGATAMRIISTWQERPASMLRLDPRWTSAQWSWIGIDLNKLMGCWWEPDAAHSSDTSGDRVAVDPYP